MKKHPLFITTCLFILACACQSNKQQEPLEAEYVNLLKDCSVVAQYKMIGGDSVLVCDMNAMKEEIELPFSSLLSSYEIVPLDTAKAVLCSPRWGKATISPNYIVVKSVDTPLRLFDRKTGKFIRQIGNLGQGPKEYLSTPHVQIEEDSNLVIIATRRPDRIVRYELSTGNYQTDYKLLFDSGSLFFCDLKKGEIIGMGEPHPRNTKGEYCFWKQTFDGKLIQGLSGKEQVGYSNHNSYTGHIDDRTNNIQVMLWDTTDIVQDTLYHYNLKENRLAPLFTIEWGEKVPTHLYIDLPHYYYCETADKKGDQYLIDKQTGKGAKINLYLDMFGEDFYIKRLVRHNYNSYTFSFLFDPVELADALQQKNQQKTIAGKVMDPDSLENENSWVLIGKWN